MRLNKIHLSILLGVYSILGGCPLIDKVEEIIRPEETSIPQKLTEQKTITLACGRGNIKEYLDKGWKVINTQESEVPCTWKTKKARRGCDIELDKGCRITIPDKMGTQIKYNLEKESIITKKDNK